VKTKTGEVWVEETRKKEKEKQDNRSEKSSKREGNLG